MECDYFIAECRFYVVWWLFLLPDGVGASSAIKSSHVAISRKAGTPLFFRNFRYRGKKKL